jgi:GT2 family glycosyltransferase
VPVDGCGRSIALTTQTTRLNPPDFHGRRSRAGARILGGQALLEDVTNKSKTSISAVVAAYQAEDWIAEALESIISQTRPPEEIVVVDDGSTDGTARELERFADRIRIIRQPNGGCPAAFNTAFRAARGDFVAMCGADDIWEPRKLEWQTETIQAHPEADVFFGHAMVVGQIEAEHSRPPGSGLLDNVAFRDALFKECCVSAPSVVIRRSLFERLGPFVENFGADDWEYWFRCLRAGARFYYDPRVLLSWRQHGGNLSAQTEWMDQCARQVRRQYAADVTGRALADDLFRSARQLVDEDRPLEARRAFRRSLRFGTDNLSSSDARALAWVAILSLPAGARQYTGRTLTSASRAIDERLITREASPQ